MTVRVVVEVAPKKSFVSALDWPGWSRGAKTPELALTAFVDYGPRYLRVAERAGVELAPPASIDDLEVVERLEGGSSTEFGIPSIPAASEEDLRPAELDRSVAILRAVWAAFDAAADEARGVMLATGPRGGGRTLEKMIGHVREAEVAYLGQLGSKPPPDPDDLGAVRAAFLATLLARVRGEPVPNPRNTKKPWSPRYAIRRSAWHSLDHAWELEDRS